MSIIFWGLKQVLLLELDLTKDHNNFMYILFVNERCVLWKTTNVAIITEGSRRANILSFVKLILVLYLTL